MLFGVQLCMYAHTWKMSIYMLKYSIVSYLRTSRKHCIEQEKQWDFLKELTAKVSQVGAEEEGEESNAPKKGRCVHWSRLEFPLLEKESGMY